MAQFFMRTMALLRVFEQCSAIWRWVRTCYSLRFGHCCQAHVQPFQWTHSIGVLNALYERQEYQLHFIIERAFFSCFNITSYHWRIQENHSTTHNYIEILFGSCEFKNHNKKPLCAVRYRTINGQQTRTKSEQKKLLPKHVVESMHQADEKKSVFFLLCIVGCGMCEPEQIKKKGK